MRTANSSVPKICSTKAICEIHRWQTLKRSQQLWPLMPLRFNIIKFIQLPLTTENNIEGRRCLRDDNERIFTTKRLLFYSLFYLQQPEKKCFWILNRKFSAERKVKVLLTKIFFGCKLINNNQIRKWRQKKSFKEKRKIFYLKALQGYWGKYLWFEEIISKMRNVF